MDTAATKRGLAPFSLKDAPALIERIFPAQKVGAEAQKERKAGAGQTLTALGSYWKGRKPLVLVRACILASLLPATADPDGDLALLDALLAMDDRGLGRRKPEVKPAHIVAKLPEAEADWAPHVEPKLQTGNAADEADGDENEDEDDTPAAGARRWRWKKIELGHVRPAERKTERARFKAEREALKARAFDSMSFAEKVLVCKRPEEIESLSDPADPLYAGVLVEANARLGTTAETLPDLVRQLGIARFGRVPLVGDPFAGGGSIPFEAARLGCGVVASDLNPVAAMLTWGALNIIGGAPETRARIAEEQRRVASAVDAEITRLGIEHDEHGNRAKAFLYCVEVVDPQTGWRVPLLPSLVISKNRRTVARLEPDHARKRFDILIEGGASSGTLKAAEAGTVQDGELIYRLAPNPDAEEREWRIPIARLRGDGQGPTGPDGTPGNWLRLWDVQDVAPREPVWDAAAPPVLSGGTPGVWRGGDVLLERLFCIQWMSADDLAEGKLRPATWFAAPDASDLAREARLRALVEERVAKWQAAGLVPDMRIEQGEKTDEPIRTRGWTHWHHLFTPRQLLLLATMKSAIGQVNDDLAACALCFELTFMVDKSARLSRWRVAFAGSATTAPSADAVENVFYNQALNTLYVYGAKSLFMLQPDAHEAFESFPINGDATVFTADATRTTRSSDIWVYDPPYADAVHYQEITEFFIAWLRRSSPGEFATWNWDSRRPLAIQGKGDKFRADMVAALRAMAGHMPDNGLQVCMFTHKDAGVWADLAQIVWGAGLQVTAAWYVSTETTSELKQGGYVQGTVLMVLRKRAGDEHGFRSDIVPEVRDRVAKQVATLTGLNQKARGRGRDENVFSDADIQMAGYAAALEVLTAYTHIDGVDMTREALRPRDGRRTAEVGIVEEMITLAVQTANELMVPDGIAEGMWERLSSEERFYLKMTATEATWPAGQLGGKLDDYQNFARVYRAADWEDLMAERSPNKARLKGAAEFKRALMTGHPFAAGTIRPTLYAIAEQWRATAQEEDPKTSGDRILHGLRDHFGTEGWMQARDNVRALASWFGTTWERQRAEEAAAARVLAGLIASERLAG